MIVTSPASTPSGMRIAASRVSSPTTTSTAMIATPLPMVIGSAFLSLWLTRPAAIRICFSRPAFCRSSALYLSTTALAFLKQCPFQHQAAYGFGRTRE